MCCLCFVKKEIFLQPVFTRAQLSVCVEFPSQLLGASVDLNFHFI